MPGLQVIVQHVAAVLDLPRPPAGSLVRSFFAIGDVVVVAVVANFAAAHTFASVGRTRNFESESYEQPRLREPWALVSALRSERAAVEGQTADRLAEVENLAWLVMAWRFVVHVVLAAEVEVEVALVAQKQMSEKEGVVIGYTVMLSVAKA